MIAIYVPRLIIMTIINSPNIYRPLWTLTWHTWAPLGPVFTNWIQLGPLGSKTYQPHALIHSSTSLTSTIIWHNNNLPSMAHVFRCTDMSEVAATPPLDKQMNTRLSIHEGWKSPTKCQLGGNMRTYQPYIQPTIQCVH